MTNIQSQFKVQEQIVKLGSIAPQIKYSQETLKKQKLGPPTKKKIVIQSNKVPQSILEDQNLKFLTSKLPKHYNFEIPKTIWRLLCFRKKLELDQENQQFTVALQFPQGLLQFSCLISDILSHFCNCECVIMGDVTYGACCVDDLSAQAMGAHFLVHYGHSCLVQVTKMEIPSMYVFVEIGIDIDHLIKTIKVSFKQNSRLMLMGTIQFNQALFHCKTILVKEVNSFIYCPFQSIKQHQWDRNLITIPQAKPRSNGQILGCTSPNLCSCQEESLKQLSQQINVIFISDGRFHIQSAMLQNPQLNDNFYLYNPYAKKITKQKYDHNAMNLIRSKQVMRATNAKTIGIIIGTLGRQGDIDLFKRLKQVVIESGKQVIVVLLSQIFNDKLKKFVKVGAWVQIACPRLSIDWGHQFSTPLLNPYECFCAFGGRVFFEYGRYPMDYYARKKENNPWSVYYQSSSSQKRGQKNSNDKIKNGLSQNKAFKIQYTQ